MNYAYCDNFNTEMHKIGTVPKTATIPLYTHNAHKVCLIFQNSGTDDTHPHLYRIYTFTPSHKQWAPFHVNPQ